MLLTPFSFASSFTGQVNSDPLTVPAFNIRQANAVYFYHVALIDGLVSLDSLNRKHSSSLKYEILLLKAENQINNQMIDNLNLQIDKYDSVNTSLVWQNRILLTCAIVLSSYLILK